MLLRTFLKLRIKIKSFTARRIKFRLHKANSLGEACTAGAMALGKPSEGLTLTTIAKEGTVESK